MQNWGFYGRTAEMEDLRRILARKRWFFLRLTGRRRIGKTTLVQRVLQAEKERPLFYLPIPDSDPAGVLAAAVDYMKTFSVEEEAPQNLKDLARLIGRLVRRGSLVALDEFQFFHRKALYEFTSHLQTEVDAMANDASEISGGLIVLGSLHTEMMALLEDRNAPLYNRATDALHLKHLDVESLLELLSQHADRSPERFLFLWNLFEGVPKFYRDCFEQGVLGADRRPLLERMFFSSSSPLRHEAAHWFLSELRGRYDLVLKFIARNPGCSNADIVAHASTLGAAEERQVGGYLQALRDRFQLVEHLQPVFAPSKARRGRYYIKDNFLRSWLQALAVPTSAVNFRPVGDLVSEADDELQTGEGHALERLIRELYEERSRKSLGDFKLSQQIEGYWDRAGTEIDFVALDEENSILRLGSCKRNAEKLASDYPAFDGHVERFRKMNKRFSSWQIQKMAFSVRHTKETKRAAEQAGYIPQDICDLSAGFSFPAA